MDGGFMVRPGEGLACEAIFSVQTPPQVPPRCQEAGKCSLSVCQGGKEKWFYAQLRFVCHKTLFL